MTTVNRDANAVLTILDDIESRIDEMRALMRQPRLDTEVRRALTFLSSFNAQVQESETLCHGLEGFANSCDPQP
jgi:hypothetical protein